MTVSRLIESGPLPAIRVGKHQHLRIHRRDVARFLDAGVVPVPGQTGSKGRSWPAA